MNETKALVTLLNRKMLIGFKVFITSFLTNNPWFDDDLIIFDLDLNDNDKKMIEKFYPKTIFKKIEIENYNNVNMNNTADRLKPTYYKLEMFSLFEYERIVFIDIDTVILADIKDLFTTEFDGIAGVKCYSEKEDNLRNDINSGVVVVTNKYLNKETYEKIISFAEQGFSMPDQKAINGFFNDIKFFNKAFNVEKRMEHSKNFEHILKNKKIVHYVAGKPWENNDPDKRKYPMMENLWNEWYLLAARLEESFQEFSTEPNDENKSKTNKIKRKRGK